MSSTTDELIPALQKERKNTPVPSHMAPMGYLTPESRITFDVDMMALSLRRTRARESQRRLLLLNILAHYVHEKGITQLVH
jgi:hypothetical protein